MKKVTLGLILLSLASPALAMTYFLTAQWNEGGNHFCRYSNGTVLNVGYHVCPMSIEG